MLLLNLLHQLVKLNKKLKNKTIVIYGAGSLFKYAKENYDLSSLNIIGISDMKFTEDQEGQDWEGYKIVPKAKIVDYAPDYVLVATQNYLGLVENFICKEFKGTKIKVGVLFKKSLWEDLKTIWK